MALYHALIESILEDEDAMNKGVADKLKKRKPDDDDRDEYPPAGLDQGLKRKKTSKDAEPSKKAKSTDTSKGTPNLSQNLLPREDMGKTDEPPIVKADLKDWFEKPKRPPTPDPEWNTGKTVDDEPTQNWLGDLSKAEKPSKMTGLQSSQGTCKSYVELEYNMEECYNALNDQLDWNNPEGDRYPFDLSKPLPLVKSRNRTSHWRSKRQTFYGYASNRVSKHDVYSTKRILAVTNVKVNKGHGYGHLEEIEVRRADQQLYKFMKGDFPRLHLNEIEDIKRLRRSNELHKFSDGILQSVWDTLHDMATNLRTGYNKAIPRRSWSNLDKTRAHIMLLPRMYKTFLIIDAYMQVIRFLALGWLLEEIHVTWAHLEKKHTRLRTYTKSLEDLCIKYVETVSQASSDAVVMCLVAALGIS
ncbi:hypothetical protein Tco_1184070 [Tanacetum coccineum]